MSNLKQLSPIKAYSMLNTNRRRFKVPNITSLNNLPSFKSYSKKYDECYLKESKNNYKNEESNNNKSYFISKSSSDNQKIRYLSSKKDNMGNNMCFITLFPLPSPKLSKFDYIFKEKIRICKMTFNNSQIKGKNEKLNALLEINSLISKNYEAKLLVSDQKNLLLEMIIVNIFDQDPFISNKNASNSIERPLEHISLVYKILNQFVSIFPEKCDFDLLKKGIRLLNLQEFNETENLVEFLTNYTKAHPEQFNEIWKLLKVALVNVKYDIYTPYCVNPIISYLNTFFISNRIKNLSNILYTHFLPLYTHEKLSIYFNKLNNLVVQIVEKCIEDQLGVIQYLIKHFPYQYGQKQPLFVSTIISIVKIIDEDTLNSISKKLFHFIAMATRSPNSRLTESALSLLMLPNMKPIIVSNYELATSILYGPLKWSYALYWDSFIKEQSRNALGMLINSRSDFNNNKALYNFISIPGKKPQQETKKIGKDDSSKIWAYIGKMASKRYRSTEIRKSVFKAKTGFTKGISYKECNKLKDDLL